MNLKKHLSLSALALVFLIPSIVAEIETPQGLLTIRCEFERPDDQPPVVHNTLGFIMEEDGHLMTTYEAIADPETGRLSGKIEASFDMGGVTVTLPASVVGVEATMNFSILKVNHESPLPAVTINDHRELETDEPVYAYHLDSTDGWLPIKGEFSELNQLECYQENLTATMLKTEIDLPEDSVGAPIIDSQGEVFAMHTAHIPDIDEEELLDDDGKPEVFLFSMDLAMNIYESIKQRKSMKSPWTGFSVRAMTKEEKSGFPIMGGRVRCGIAIEHVWEGSPAEKLGIQSGDILIKFGHYPVCQVAEFQKWLYMYGVDQPTTLLFARDGKLVSFDYIIEERPTWAKPR